MTLRLAGSTSGYTEIDAPAVAGSNTLVLPTGNGSSGQVLTTNGSGVLSFAQGGRILQVAQATKTDIASTASTSFVDISGLSTSITVANSSNKVLVFVQLGGAANNPYTALFNLVRGATTLAQPDTGSEKASLNVFAGGGSASLGGHALIWLDSPATAGSITYKVQWRSDAGTSYLNRHTGNANYTSVSTITVMEVAA